MNVRLFVICIFLKLLIIEEVRAQVDEEFTLVREEDSIYIYERWIKFPGTNPPQDAREVKGEFTTQSTFKELIKLIKDPKMMMRTQKHVTEFKAFPLTVDTAWLEYTYHDIPWPVSDQDHLLVYKIKKQSDDEMVVIFESTKNYDLAPIRPGVDRMNLLGSWTLQKLNDQTIKCQYRIISEPSNIPRIFTDPIIRRNMVITIRSIKSILEEEDL